MVRVFSGTLPGSPLQGIDVLSVKFADAVLRDRHFTDNSVSVFHQFIPYGLLALELL